MTKIASECQVQRADVVVGHSNKVTINLKIRIYESNVLSNVVWGCGVRKVAFSISHGVVLLLIDHYRYLLVLALHQIVIRSKYE